ncbi:hypothetical protein EGH21_15705 [Halomicroarcula sp. F13]|uniref:Uncharacterized protein n=1 Tax=Haloarcula rubra TaxID=2487747 RepID=A0AAW4PTB1_9EURY|nr:hypothetical protein [Halomicroarcula rubra]
MAHSPSRSCPKHRVVFAGVEGIERRREGARTGDEQRGPGTQVVDASAGCPE